MILKNAVRPDIFMIKAVVYLSSPTTILHACVIGATITSLSLAILLPIYTDEVGWKILQARYYLDGGRNITLFPQCGAPFATTPPWFMLPARIIDAWLYGALNEPIKLRLLGVASFAAFLGFVLVLLAGNDRFVLRGIALPGAVFGFFGIGMFPLLMVINRPEQTLLLGLAAVLLAPFVLPKRLSVAGGGAWLATLSLITVWLVSQHPKALLFAPLIALSGWLTLRSWTMRAILIVTLGYLVLHSYQYWTMRNACPADPAIAEGVARQLMPLSALASDPLAALAWLSRNLFQSWQWPRSVLFWSFYPSDWFPRHPLTLLTGAAFVLVAGVLLSLFLLILAEVLYWGRRTIKELRISKEAAVIIVLVASLFGLSSLQAGKGVYEAVLALPLLFLGALVCAPTRWRRAIRRAAIGLSATSLISQMALWSLLATHTNAFLQGGYIASQHKSFSAFRYESAARRISETAAQCGIDSQAPPPGLVIDDYTYPVFSRSFRPLHVSYALLTYDSLQERFTPMTGKATTAFLRHVRSGGVIAGCHLLPDPLRQHAQSGGDFCCVSPFWNE